MMPRRLGRTRPRTAGADRGTAAASGRDGGRTPAEIEVLRIDAAVRRLVPHGDRTDGPLPAIDGTLIAAAKIQASINRQHARAAAAAPPKRRGLDWMASMLAFFVAVFVLAFLWDVGERHHAINGDNAAASITIEAGLEPGAAPWPGFGGERVPLTAPTGSAGSGSASTASGSASAAPGSTASASASSTASAGSASAAGPTRLPAEAGTDAGTRLEANRSGGAIAPVGARASIGATPSADPALANVVADRRPLHRRERPEPRRFHPDAAPAPGSTPASAPMPSTTVTR